MKTAVGLFKNPKLVDDAVRQIEATGLTRNHIRKIEEPLNFAVSGVMSIPHVEFEVHLTRELMRIGASKSEAEDYVDGVKHGGVLVFATGTDEQVDTAIEIMNRHNVQELEEVDGPEPEMSSLRLGGGPILTSASSVQTGRIRQGDGARVFVW